MFVKSYLIQELCTLFKQSGSMLLFYGKRLKLSERKVSRLSEFHPIAGKLLQCSFICIESAAIAHSIRRENFHDSSKIYENHQSFSLA